MVGELHQWIGLRENFNRKAPYKKWENLWFPVDLDFPLNQPIDSMIYNDLPTRNGDFWS